MKDWHKGWFNFVMVCPKGCGVSRGYLAEDTELAERCMMCNEEMEGFRTLTKENK